jgi:peptide/nickel transport system substrate-binding protein/oligopeptide transport system substrate-binding protein
VQGNEAPQKGGTFRMIQDSPGSLDPACLDDVYEATISNQIFDGILTFDANLNSIPGIAESWEISPDGLVYTFHLRSDVLFHDGTPVTAKDVVYSFTRIYDLPESDSQMARDYLGHILGSRDYAAGKAESIQGLEALDARTVRITLDEPFGSFLAVLAADPAHIVPKHYVERVGAQEFARHPIGSGPFQVAEWQADKRIVLTKFAASRLREARLDSIVFEFAPEGARDQAADSFLRGELSAVVVPDGRLPEFMAQQGSQVLTRQELSLSFIGFNNDIEPFDDVRVRRAFAMAIDRGRLLQDSSARSAPTGILPPGMPGYTPVSRILPHDPDEARRLLAEAGHPGGAGLPRVRLTIATGTSETLDFMRLLAEQVAEVGFDVEIERLTWLEFSRKLTTQSLQCFNVTWVADIPDPDSFLHPIGNTGGSANFTSYSNREVDALLSRGRSSRNALERMDVYREVERIILADAPVVPLFHPLSAVAVKKGVHGVAVTPMGVGNLAMENVWVASNESAGQRGEAVP